MDDRTGHPTSPHKESTCLGNIYLSTFTEFWTVSACVFYLHRVETKSCPELYRILLTIWSTYLTEQHDAIGTLWQPLNCCSHQLHIFSCFYIHVLSLFSCFKCPISIPNCLIFIWSVFASGTELLRGIMNLCQKAFCVAMKDFLFSKFTCTEIHNVLWSKL